MSDPIIVPNKPVDVFNISSLDPTITEGPKVAPKFAIPEIQSGGIENQDSRQVAVGYPHNSRDTIASAGEPTPPPVESDNLRKSQQPTLTDDLWDAFASFWRWITGAEAELEPNEDGRQSEGLVGPGAGAAHPDRPHMSAIQMQLNQMRKRNGYEESSTAEEFQTEEQYRAWLNTLSPDKLMKIALKGDNVLGGMIQILDDVVRDTWQTMNRSRDRQERLNKDQQNLNEKELAHLNSRATNVVLKHGAHALVASVFAAMAIMSGGTLAYAAAGIALASASHSGFKALPKDVRKLLTGRLTQSNNKLIQSGLDTFKNVMTMLNLSVPALVALAPFLLGIASGHLTTALHVTGGLLDVAFQGKQLWDGKKQRDFAAKHMSNRFKQRENNKKFEGHGSKASKAVEAQQEIYKQMSEMAKKKGELATALARAAA